MGFHETAKFPKIAEYGTQGGPGGNATVTRLRSGAEERNTPWSGMVHRYDVSLDFKTRQQAQEVRRFYHLRNGLENGFRFEDPEDHNSTEKGYDADEGPDGQDAAQDDIEIGVGDGSTTVFQLVKTYDNSVDPVRTRTITKPIIGTVLVEVNGVLQTEDTHYTVNYATGEITFMTAPTSSHSVKAGFKFDVPVRFGEEINTWFPQTSSTFDSGALATCTLIELIDPPYADDEWWPGGSNTFSFGANTQLSLLDGKLKIATATTTSLKLILPMISSIPANGQYFKVWCETGSEDFDIVDSNGTTVTSMTGGDVVWLHIITGTNGVRTWRSE